MKNKTQVTLEGLKRTVYMDAKHCILIENS